MVFAAVSLSAQVMTVDDLQRQCKTVATSIASEIGITADQVHQIDAYANVLGSDIRQVCSSTLSQDEKITKVQSLIDTSVSTVMSIITSEQKTKGMKAVCAWLSMVPAGSGINVPRSEVVKAMQRTGLTVAQAEGILDVLGNHIKKVSTQLQDSSLTPQQQEAKLWQLRLQTCDEIKTKLNPEQQKVFTAMLTSTISTYEQIKSQLTSDQKTDLDALAAKLFSFLEKNVNIY